jgi:hypothetical protein
MGDQKKPRGLKPEQWAEVRKAYESGEAVLSISKRFGARRQTIMDRAKRETWTAQPTAHVSGPEVAKTVHRNVIDIASRRALSTPQGKAAVEAATEAVAVAAEELLATVTAARKAATYINDLLDKALNGEIIPASAPGEQTDADVAKSVMTAYRTFTTTVRENAGVKVGAPSVPRDDAAEKVDKIKFRIVREPTGTDG